MQQPKSPTNSLALVAKQIFEIKDRMRVMLIGFWVSQKTS